MALFPTVEISAYLGGAYSDLVASRDVAMRDGLTIRTGIQGYGPSARVASTGTAQFSLRNSTLNSGGVLGYYSQFHASKRTNWTLGVPLRIRITDPSGGGPITRFQGTVDTIDPIAGKYRERTVRVTAVDWMDEAARWVLTADVGPQENAAFNEIAAAIIATMTVQPTATDYDTGSETYPFALHTSLIGQQTTLSELQKLAMSEFGYIYVKGNGTLVMENRHRRLVNSISSLSAWTLADTDFVELEAPVSRADIINVAKVTVHPATVDAAATTVVFSQPTAIPLSDGATITLTVSFSDPTTGRPCGATALQDLVSTTDYLANSLADGTGTNQTATWTVTRMAYSTNGATYSITNSSGSLGYLTLLQQRGKAVKDFGVRVMTGTYGSTATYGTRAGTFDMSYQSDPNVGQACADYIVDRHRFGDINQRPRRIKVLGKTTTLLTQILNRDVGDSITLSETVTGINNQFFIHACELTIDANGLASVVYNLIPADAAGSYWILGTSTLGTDTIPAPF